MPNTNLTFLPIEKPMPTLKVTGCLLTAAKKLENLLRQHQSIDLASTDHINNPLYNKKMLQQLIEKNLSDLNMQEQERLLQDFLIYGPLHTLISNEGITEILCNGYNEIYYELDGKIIKHQDVFFSEHNYQSFIQRMLLETGQQINLEQPFSDGKWKNFRLHIIQPPLAHNNTLISLRRKAKENWTLKKLKNLGSITKKESDYLQNLVKTKKNLLIIGPTSSGKTALINALLQEVEHTERVLCIEDTDEISSPNALSGKLLTRNDPQKQLSNYSQTDLLKQSLRMRPDRLILGEIRSDEAKDFLMMLSTGHQGCMASLHADQAHQALWRLEMLIQMAAPQWNSSSIQKLISLSLNYVILIKKSGKQRQLKNIYEIKTYEDGIGFILEKINLK
ncbi:MAG: CpaF family protein [Bdellovibrionaceae bacterium]|nr:CpaF family protein [Pseudobdellovibrionaceae bacterium]